MLNTPPPTSPLPTPAPTSDTPSGAASALPHPTSPLDRSRLTLLYRTFGDTVAFIGSVPDADPFELLAWLNQPHIKAWHQLIAAAFRENRQLETQRALSRAIRDISRVMDLEADSTLRIRAVTAITRLANALQRSLPAAGRAGEGWAKTSRNANTAASRAMSHDSSASPTSHPHLTDDPTPAQIELLRAHDHVEDELSRLTIHMERVANHTEDLEDLKAPLGTPPTRARPCEPADPTPLTTPQLPTQDSVLPTQHSRPPAPILARLPIANRKPKIESRAKAGCPIPPPSKRKRTRRPQPRRKPRGS